MKTALLIIVRPFWLFLSKFWIGNLIMVMVALLIIPAILCLIFPNFMLESTEDGGFGIVIGLISIFCSPFIGTFFMSLSDKLETIYLHEK